MKRICLSFLFILLNNMQYVNGLGSLFFFWNEGPQRREIILPTIGMRADVDIIDGIADVVVNQFFVTSTDEYLPDDEWESKYEIPIDEEASVYSFKARYLDRVIDGIVKSDEKAKEDFENALDQGKPALLGEQSSGDTFKIEFGNIPLDIFLIVEIAYVAPVQVLDREKLRFVLPRSLAPTLRPEAFNESAINSDVIGDLPFENGIVALVLKACSSAGNITASSPTHTIAIMDDDGGGGCEVVNMYDVEQTRRDVVILLETEEVQDVEVEVYQTTLDDGTTALMLSLFPNTSTYETLSFFKNEFIFLVDRSGSMIDERISQTSKALKEMLNIMTDDTLFNIIGFGDNFFPIFYDSQNKSDTGSFFLAQAYADSLVNGHFGETNLLKPIEWVLNKSPAVGYKRSVFVLTDSDLTTGDADEILSFVKNNRETTRFFPIGIGNEVNRVFINGLARSGEGTAEFVDNNELSLITELAERQVKAASQAGFLTNFDVQWGVLDSNSGIEAPYGIDTVFADRRTLIYYLTSDEVPSMVNITALIGGLTEIEYSAPQSAFKTLSNPNLITKMAAKEAIRDLEEGRSILNLKESEDGLDEEDVVSCDTGYPYDLVKEGPKCTLNSPHRLFHSRDDEPKTILECHRMCEQNSTCQYFSLRNDPERRNSKGVCIGCKASACENFEESLGFNTYELCEDRSAQSTTGCGDGSNSDGDNDGGDNTPELLLATPSLIPSLQSANSPLAVPVGQPSITGDNGGSGGGNDGVSDEDNDDVRNEIIRIGVKYQIASSETTFVAIDNKGWTSFSEKNDDSDGDNGGGDTDENVDIGDNGGGDSGGDGGGDGGGDSDSGSADDDDDFGGGGGFNLCFAAENKVLVAHKGYVQMKHLRIGDMVQVGVGKEFSRIYSFGHYSQHSRATYLQLHLNNTNAPLEMSENHMVYLKKIGFVPASSVSVNDDLVTVSNKHETAVGRIIAIKKVHRTGAFAPFTETGTIVVGNVLASSYVSLQNNEATTGSFTVAGGAIRVVEMQWIAHAFQIPHRLYCQHVPKTFSDLYCTGERYTRDGISYWVYGPYIIFKWIISQHPMIFTILSIPVVLSALTLQLLEFIFVNSFIVSCFSYLLLALWSLSRLKTHVPKK